MKSRTLLALVALALLLTSCTGDDDASPGTSATTQPPATTTFPTSSTTSTTTTTTDAPPMAGYTTASCEFDLPTDRSVECGWLEVPADRSDPDSGTIRLHVAVFASESANPAPDPVVYLEGGPGGDALEIMPLLFEDAYAHLLADRDFIVFDQRGTGYSEPALECPEYRNLAFDVIDQDLPAEAFEVMQLAALGACRDRLVAEGAQLDAYNSAASAADLADLRQALGIDEWNLYGLSYGTRLALTAMRDQPEGIRSVILDSVYPPNVDVISETIPNMDRALRTLFDGCAADPACAAAYPDVETTFYRLLEDLESNPIRMPVTDLFTGQGYDAVLDGATLGGLVFQSLYSDEAIPVLPQLITNVAAGETYDASILASAYLVNLEFLSIGMQLSVQCNEESGFSSPAILERTLDIYPRLAPIFESSANIGGPFFEICDLWGAGTADPIENEPVTSDIPTLILAGEYDPITPPAWGRLAAETLPNSTYAEFAGFGHGPSTSSECAQSIVRDFLNTPDATPDLACTDSLEPPAFVTPDTEIPDINLVPFTQDGFGATLSGVVPEGWQEAGPGVWARGVTGFDQTALIQQFAPGADADLVLGLLASQFGLGEDPVPAETYTTALGEWSIYGGSVVGTPASIAVIDLPEGTGLVALLTTPAETDTLRNRVFFPALDALTVN